MSTLGFKDGALHPGPADSFRARLWVWVGALLLLAAAYAAFGNSLDGDFGGDARVVAYEGRVQQTTTENVKLIFLKDYWYPVGESTLYRPATVLSYLFNYAVLGEGDRPFGYHLFNLIVHFACVLLAYFVALATIGRDLRAWFAAAIFAVHPASAEAVTNIAGRADELVAMALLAVMLIHIHAPNWTIHAPNWTGAKRLLAGFGIFLCTLFATASKESGVIALGLLILYDWIIRPNLPKVRLVAGYAGASAATLLFLIARLQLMKQWHSANASYLDNPLIGQPFLAARLTAIKVTAMQLALLFWPQHLSWDYSYNQIPVSATGDAWLALPLLAGLAALAVWLRRRSPAASFFALFFFFSLAPVCNVFVLIGTIRGDRLLYLPSLGFGAVVAMAVWWAAGKLAAAARERRQLVQMAAASAVLLTAVVALTVRAEARSAVWADNFRLATEDQLETPGSYRSRYSAALARLSRAGTGDYDDLMRKVQEAIDILAPVRPALSIPLPYTTMGQLWRRKAEAPSATPEERAKGYEEALRYLAQAETIDSARRADRASHDLARGWRPDMLQLTGDLQVYRHELEILQNLGRITDAEQKGRILLLLSPETPETHQRMARIEADLGRPNAASLEIFEESELNENQALDPAVGRLLMEADPGSCAVKADGSVNHACPLVSQAAAAAHAQLMELLRLSGRADRIPVWEQRWTGSTAGRPSGSKEDGGLPPSLP